MPDPRTIATSDIVPLIAAPGTSAADLQKALRDAGGLNIAATASRLGPALIGTFGHSFAARQHLVSNNGSQGVATYLMAYGWSSWLQSLLRGRAIFPYSLNFGVIGQNTSQMLARVQAAVDAHRTAGAWGVIFSGLYNDDLSTAAARATTVSNIQAIAKAFTNAGIVFICTDDYPAGFSGNVKRTGGQLSGFHNVRHWMLRSLPALVPGAICVPTYGDCTQFDNAGGFWRAGYSDPADYIHPMSPTHALSTAPRIFAAIDKLLPSQTDWMCDDPSDVFDATHNPRGNLLGNGMLTGTGGSVPSGFTGTLADSWTGTKDASLTNITATLSKVAGTNSVWQQLALSGTSGATDGAVTDLRRNFSLSQLSPGDVLRSKCMVEIDGGFTGIRGVESRVVLFDSGNTYESKSLHWGLAADMMPVQAYTGANALYLMTPDLTLPAAFGGGALVSGYFAVRLLSVANASVSATLRLGRAECCKVA